MTNQSHLGRKAADTLYRNHFGAFVYAAFEVVNPGLKTEAELAHRLCVPSPAADGHRPECQAPRPQPAAAQPQIFHSRWPCQRGCWVEIPAHG